jgi:hypothetical protein
MGTKHVQKNYLWTHFVFHPKLWTKKKFWTGRGGEDSPSPNSILWDLDVGRKFWLPVEML